MNLHNLKNSTEVSEILRTLFPTNHAVEHFIRQNRSALIEKGVLHVVNTRKFLDIEKLGPFLEELSAQKLGRVA